MKKRKNQESKFWDSLAKKYDPLISKYASENYNRVIQLIKDELWVDAEVLEVACGTGIISLALSDALSTITAIDYADEMLNVAKEKQLEQNIGNVSFQNGDVYNLNFNDHSFDAIVGMNIFHLLPEPQNALAEIKRVLKPDGTILLPTYCHGDNLASLSLSYLTRLSGFKVPNRWSVNQFHSFINNSGFKITNTQTFKGKFPLAYVVAKKG